MKILLLVVALVSIVGCHSAPKVTLNDQTYISSLSEAEQTHIANGDPSVGDSVRGVMISLGKPAFIKKVPEGVVLIYYSIVSKRYPKTIDHEYDWDVTTNLQILVSEDSVVRVKVTPNYEDRNRGAARR